MLKLWWKFSMVGVMLIFLMEMEMKNIMMSLSVMKQQKNMEISIINDMMSNTFTVVVMTIVMMVAMFSVSYMSHEKNKKRFTIIISLFALSMIILMYMSNLFSMMIGWDGLGLTSFCLVIFFQNKESMKSGLITMFTNRLGDCLMISTIMMMMTMKMMKMEKSWYKMIMIVTVIGAFTKSAQMPFSAWLPAAMAAPTPVSSLVHSSTLVTAGTFLISRFKILMMSTFMSKMVMTSAMLTSMTAGMTAWKEMDAKKIVAMSTLSQLGLMVFALSLNYWKLCLFHMITHAIFKALLFINTGYSMNNNFGAQEKRKMKFPKSTLTLANMTAIMSLMGVPFLSGFYSKDMILEKMMTKEINLLMAILFVFACIITTTYSFILMKFVYKKSNFFKLTEKKSDIMMMIPSSIMTILSMITGCVTANLIMIQTPKVNTTSKALGMIIILLGVVMSKMTISKEMTKKMSSMVITNKLSYSPISALIYKHTPMSKKGPMNIIDSPKMMMYKITEKNSKFSWKITKKEVKKTMMMILVLLMLKLM